MTKNKSLWIETSLLTNYPTLLGKKEVDVVIVGGGLAGITAGYFLQREGKKVAILEAFRIGMATSGHTTAKVTSLHGLIYDFLLNNFGEEKAKIYADSNQWAISQLEEITKKEKIDCDFFRANSYTFSNKKENLEKIRKEFEATKKLGLPSSFEQNLNILPFKIKNAVRFSNQALFHPRKFLLSLAEIIVGNRNFIFENSRVLEVKEGQPFLIKTQDGEIKAKNVIIATNYPIYDKAKLYKKMDQRRSYAYGVRIKGFLTKDMFLGLEKDEVSVRPYINGSKSWLVIGGDQPERLKYIIEKLFPVKSFDYQWAAQDSSPIDRVPYIGRQSKDSNIFVTTGFDEWGMTKSFVSAKALCDLIMKKRNSWAEFYDPKRISIRGSIQKLPKVGKEILEGFGKKIMPLGGDIKKIKRSEGKVVEKQGEKLAVYRDEEGILHAVSAVCTHLGCIVGWNSNEKSWDCPCHGSRFSRGGKVINGPAQKNLEKKEI